MLAKIPLPAGTKKILVDEIVPLIVDAILPRLPEDTPKTIPKIKKFPLTDAARLEHCGPVALLFGVTMTPQDLAELAASQWNHLPPISFPIEVSQWKKYQDAFNENPRSDWKIALPKIDDPRLWRGMERCGATESHETALKKALSNGSLKAYSANHLPLTAGDVPNGAFVTVEDFQQYAARLQIETVFADTTGNGAPLATKSTKNGTSIPSLAAWKNDAWAIGLKWMLEQEQQSGTRPSQDKIALYVEGELSNRGITGARGKFLDRATIKREALKGMTGRLANGQKPKK